MAYRNKTYICFDADIDMRYYNLLKAWKENENIDILFHNAHEINTIRPWSSEETIKRNLRERMKNTKLIIVLIGEKTKNLYKYVRWEIELALSMDIPIIAVNLNKVNGIDNLRCPPILRDKPVLHIPFKRKAVEHSLKYWSEI
ncbi:TIR domain-containing protein [Heyndrickxia camelliae]|uniref:Molecular chaperone Tir n=1 Tax=Heyndrickxia camelliae TaxID=1707093 RepID=A0A2N3LCW3_9BACI|nr:TIR domain-containing protein [Heyndrickxia camelliae]PKR82403.1 molecular chaperone Tir [Heyndrickxia camelliae]